MRKNKGLHYLADINIILCNGRTIDYWILTTEPLHSSRRFPVERPTISNFKLFGQAISMILLLSIYLPMTLGKCMSLPHPPNGWFVNVDKSEIYHAPSNASFDKYILDTTHRVTRFGSRFGPSVQYQGQCPRHL